MDPDLPIPRRHILALLGAGLATAGLGHTAYARRLDKAGDNRMDDIANVANRLAGHSYFLMVAEWELKDGTLERAKEIIASYRPFILKADGIKIFLAAHDRTDPNHILFYEAYESEAHYKAHAAGEAFQKYIIREGLPLVAKRTLNTYTLL